MGGITMMNSRTLRSALVVAMVLTGTGGVILSGWALESSVALFRNLSSSAFGG